MAQAGLEGQQALVRALRLALGGAAPARLFETHISWVLVAPPHAYKIKKAVRLAFLDFSTLAARRHFCEAELRLNRRLAPALYEAVVPVTGSCSQPRLGGSGEPIEYAIRMRAFPQDALWTSRIAHQVLAPAEVDELARQLATFHMAAARAPASTPWGTPGSLREAARENIAQLERVASGAGQRRAAARLRAWQEDCGARLWPLFEERKAGGWIRECHGDLHCGNILTLDGAVCVFDCIEFDDALRWIDVIHDIAFASMDLRQRGQEGLAARLVNRYLELTGDYAGAAVLRYYEAQCALVRAKIALVRAAQVDRAEAQACRDSAAALLATASVAAGPQRPGLVVMHGFAGSGKSTVARALVELLGAVQLRSDVERKRMHAPGSQLQDIYSQRSTQAVYRRLGELAGRLLDAGITPVIDACNLKRQERAAFLALADAHGVPAVLVDVAAGEATMRARIRQRLRQGLDPSDADERVLDLQLRVHEPLAGPELAQVARVDSEAPFDPAPILRALGLAAR